MEKIMYTNKYLIAGKVIEITSLYERVQNYCKDYLTDGKPDFRVEITQADIETEKEKSDSEYAYEGKAVPNFP